MAQMAPPQGPSLTTIILYHITLFWFFWPCHAACGILVPQQGIEPVPPAWDVQSLNHWTATEVPHHTILTDNFLVHLFVCHPCPQNVNCFVLHYVPSS